MIRLNEYCPFDVCKLLNQNGYKEGSERCIKEHQEDYIYDNDPEHSESHKKGEINSYDFYYKNGDKSNANLFEMPTIYEVQKWLRDKHNLNIYPQFHNNGWTYEIVDYTNKEQLITYSSLTIYEKTAEKAVINGIRKALNVIYQKY